MKKFVIIPAAGSGTRLGSDIPKQFIKINEKYILTFCLDVFDNHNHIDGIILVTSENYIKLVEQIVNEENYTKVITVIQGGKERQDSVYNAIKFLKNIANSDDIVLIHDAARPLITKDIINNIIDNTIKYQASVVAVRAKDTVLDVENLYLQNFIDRNRIFLAQTPQAFVYCIIDECFNKAYSDKKYFTDESTMVKYYGYNVNITEGNYLNFKITTQEDLYLLKKIIEEYDS